jgi:hypothetical protein
MATAPDAEYSGRTGTACGIGGATDAIFILRFRNNEQDATSLYTRFLTTFRAQMSGAATQPASRKFVVADVYWPRPFTEEEDMGGSVQSADDEIAGCKPEQNLRR